MKLTVVGSLNVDHYQFVRSLPRPGETVAALSSRLSHGGKGANHAGLRFANAAAALATLVHWDADSLHLVIKKRTIAMPRWQ